jgi:tetratricopeptide (TPR) repeat protein
MKKIPFLFLFSLVSIFYISCTPQQQPVTKTEADEVARTIQASVLNKNPEFLNRFLDIDALCGKMAKLSGVRFTAADRQRFAEGIKKRKIGNEILKDFKKGSLFDLVQQYERNGKQHLVFRVYYADGGLNYYDYTLIKKGEKIKAEDMLIYTSGESLSVIATRVMKDLEKKKYDLEDISGGSKIRDLVSAGNFEEAYETYQHLTPAVQKQKTFMQLKIEITSSMDDNELYVNTLEEYRGLFPKDTNIPLLMIDAYFLKGKYEKALACVNQLDQMVQGDPFLDYYRGLCFKQMNEIEKYRSTFEKLYRYKPGFQDAAIELISIYLETKEPAKAKEIVAAYRRNLLLDQELLTTYLEEADAPEDIASL